MTGFWWRRDEPPWAEALLWPLSLASLAYRAGSAVARRRARPVRAGAPVISVGNLVAGGAGKTPVTLALAERLLRRGRKPAVLSRGYGRRAHGGCAVVDEHTPAAQSGDEPALLKRRCPELMVLVGPRRTQLAAEAVRRGADVLLLDDGLQHHALHRDLDVVVLDASNPLGNGRLLPRGPLRELPQGLQRVRRGLLWLTRCDLPRAPGLPDLRLAGPVESAFAPLDARLAGKAAFAFAGVARPQSFEALLSRTGGRVVGTRWFPDHHAYRAHELRQLRRAAELAGADVLATTEKDLVRLSLSDLTGPPPIVAVPVELRLLRGEEALDGALDEVLR